MQDTLLEKPAPDAPAKPARNTSESTEGWQDQTGLLSTKSQTENHGQSAAAAAGVLPKEQAGNVRPAVRYRVIFGTAYLAGLLTGSIGYAFLGQDAKTYAGFFREALLELFRTSEPLQIFSSQYLAAFLQLSLTALCGLCALGMPLLFFQLAVRGAVFGCFCAALLTEYRLQGALIAGVLFWLPEVLQVLLQILLSISASRSALQLGRLCFGKNGSRRSETPHRLINCYLTVCFAALIPSALSAILALLFGPLAGG